MKRVLVLSNNCFSDTNSNGRTLGNLFKCYDKDCIAQFFISGTPDNKYCNKYFQVSDSDVINSIVRIKKRSSGNGHVSSYCGHPRNVKNMIIRNLIWDIGRWKNNGFLRWVDCFNPEIVLIQAGDCSFMNRLAVWLSNKYKIPIVIYNTETYYFKSHNYFRDGSDLLYTLFLRDFRRTYNKMLKKTALSIYLCDAIEERYRIELDAPGEIIYNSSDLEVKPMNNDFFPKISYIGNLGLGRDNSLCEIGSALYRINQELCIDVYGKADGVVEEKLRKSSGIKYHGFISYDEVKNVIEHSHILIHVESFEPFFVKDSEYGFSTKIADSLVSGRVLFVYSPQNVACAKYLNQFQVGVVVSSQCDLIEKLSGVVKSFDNCKMIAEKQLIVGRLNHSIETNSIKFCKLLNEL